MQTRMKFIISAALMAACLVAFPSPASAHRGHSKHAPRAVAHGHYKAVPRVIAAGQVGYYRPYLAGRVYYARHHHHHVRYRFPVYVNGAIVYQPYHYCGSNLFVSGAVTLPHLAIGVHLGSFGGLFVGAYDSPEYDSRPRYDDHHERHHRCDHDEDD